MAELPKIVRERLQAAARQAGDHPDLNLLTAFAEQSLNQDERARVMEHLSGCQDCREVVSLAAPEFARAAGAAAVPAKRQIRRAAWMRGSVLRWGAVAACLVVVGAAVLLRYSGKMPRETYQAKVVTTDNKAAVAAPLAQKFPEEELRAKAEASPAPAPKREFAAKTRVARREQQPAPVNSRLAAASPSPALGKMADQDKRGERAESVIAGNAASPTVIAEAKPATPPAEVAATLEAGKKDVPGKAKAARAPAAAPVPAVSVANGLAASAREDAFRVAQYRAGAKPQARWTVSSEGAVQRSFDAGKTWENVLVAQVAFRALAAVGSDVWVGGPAGSLYHSSDEGAHWTRIQPTVGGVTLAEDIAAIEFADAQHGKLITTSRETWITADSGQTWQKQ